MTQEDQRELNNRYLRSLPSVCKCGHGQMEHYDGHSICTWVVENECDCEQYERIGTQTGTSVPTVYGDPQNVGSKPARKGNTLRGGSADDQQSRFG